MEFLEEEILVLTPERVGGREQGQAVSKVSHGTTYFVVFVVGCWILNVVATHYIVIAVFGVGFPFEKIDFTQQFLLMVFEFADHCDQCRSAGGRA